jgi:phosphatidate cytidylyltransferase
VAGRSEFFLRVASALVLAPLALATAYVGGWPFALFWGIGALAIWWEWTAFVAGPERWRAFMAGAAILAGALVLIMNGRVGAALVLVAIGAAVAAALAPAERRVWGAAGVGYAVAPLSAVVLRDDAGHGFLAIVFLFAVVWVTDIFAYFAGRAIGGPKLWPRVSPKKTWSGAIGGTVAAMAAGVVTALIAGLGNLPAIASLALVLSVTSQSGDLLESAIKRCFGTKDASHLIPGHGGVMDRLDGFLAAALAAAIIGVARGGADASARGLLVW